MIAAATTLNDLSPLAPERSRHPVQTLRLLLFGCLVAAYLIPIWVFAYLPTQDGPLHLANAVILKDHGTPNARYGEFFDLCWEPFPNWTTHILLVALQYLVAPLVAEKV